MYPKGDAWIAGLEHAEGRKLTEILVRERGKRTQVKEACQKRTKGGGVINKRREAWWTGRVWRDRS